MYKSKSMRLRRWIAMIMAVLLISGQLQTVAYAKETTNQMDVKQNTASQAEEDSLDAQDEEGQEDDIKQGNSLEEEGTEDTDSTTNQEGQEEQGEVLEDEITNELKVNEGEVTEESEENSEEIKNQEELVKKSESTKENKEKSQKNITEDIVLNQFSMESFEEDYNKFRDTYTNSYSGFTHGLGTASNFGIFVNGQFNATADFESNLAVSNFYASITPQIPCSDDSPKVQQQLVYIQNFTDANGNILKENPLPINYNLVAPNVVLGSGYEIDQAMEEVLAYKIDGKRLGYTCNVTVLQDPVDEQLVDFESEFAYLNGLSTFLASLATTTTASVKTNGNNLELESNSAQVDIFNLSSVDFLTDSNVNTNVNLQASNDTTCIINVDMSDITDFEWNTQVSINGQSTNLYDEAGKVLWNFYTTEIDGNGEVIYKPYEGRLATTAFMQGTFLTPSATVEIGAGNYIGSIVAKNLLSNTSKITKASFRGSIPEDITKKSETTSKESTLNLGKTATYTGDFNSNRNTGNRTYQVDLSAVATPVETEKKEVVPNDIVLVLDRSGSMSETGASGSIRLDELKQAAKSFVNSIKETSPESSIDIISYSADDGAQAVTNDTAGFVNVANDYSSITGAIDNLVAQGATRTDLGMKAAYDSLNEVAIRNDGRPKTVVLFTDGVPTMWDTFDDGVANAASTYATKIKSEFGSTVFTIGLLSTLSESEKAKAEIFLNGMASNKSDSSTEKRFYQTTDNLSLEDIFIKISSEITGEVVGATVRDYLSEYFVLTEKSKAKLDMIDDVSYGYNKSSKKWYVEWKNQTIPIEGNWSTSIEIESKNEFIGGNDIVTNGNASGIYVGNTLLAKFPQPKVNVPVKFEVGNEETTIRQGDLIPTKIFDKDFKLDDKELQKKESVQTLMFDENSVPDIFLEKAETGTFTYKWYWGEKLVGEGKDLETLVDGVYIDKDTVLTLKVTFEPYHSDTTTDGQKGLAESTPHTGTYTVHVTIPVEKRLWVNKCATYTGDFNSEDNTGKRTYLVKLVSNTLKNKLDTENSTVNDIVLVLDRSRWLETSTSLRKNYSYSVATNITEGGYYNLKVGDEYRQIRLLKDRDNRFYYDEYDSNTHKFIKVYLDEGIQLYNLPGKEDYVSSMVHEKEAAISFINSLKKTSPESNICIISYASDSGSVKGVENNTEGFKKVSTDSESIINAINSLSAGGETRTELGLQEAYNILTEESIKSNGRPKTVVLCSTGIPRINGGKIDYDSANSAINYANLLKEQILANIYTIEFPSNTYGSVSESSEKYLTEIASKVTTNSDAKNFYKSSAKGDIFSNISKAISGEIVGATILDYIDERFQLTEETKKIFDADDNISYGFDKSRNQWYVKYDNQNIPTNDSVWFEQFEIEAKGEYIGGNCIPTNGLDSGIYIGKQKLKDFPKPTVNVPIKFEVGNEETTIFYGESVPQQLYDANTLKYKDVQTLMFDEKAVPDMFVGKVATGSFKYEWYRGNILIGEGKDLNTLVKDLELEKDALYTLKVTFIPKNQENPSDNGKGLAKDTPHTGVYKVKVVKGALTIQKTIDNQYTDINVVNANQSFVFEIKRYAVNSDGSQGDYIESYFETINFAANEGITSKDTTIVNLKKGYYEVVEDTDWSWKYNLVSVVDNDKYSNAGTGVVFVGNKNDSIPSTNHYFGEVNVESALAKVEVVNNKKDVNWLGDVSVAINKFMNKSR